MRHKSTTDYKHFLEDLAGMYPFSVEEAALTEIIANCLDAKASVIKITTDKSNRVFEVLDNGAGMNEKEFENYHNFSMTFKEKGKGIGFAGLGAKLALKIAEKIITETFDGKHKYASCWEFVTNEPEWEDIKHSLIDKQGTLVRIRLKAENSLLLDAEKIESIILKHYYPLFLFEDFYKLAKVYPAGVTFVLNGDVIKLPAIDTEDESPRIFLTKGRKKKPFGICKFSLCREPVTEELQDIGISCYGKVINTEQKELFKQQPKNPEKITGIIEVPELVDCLVTSKTAFRKDGYCGVKYYNFYKIAQQHFIKWLEEIGQREAKIEEEKDIKITQELTKLIGKIISDIPELHTLFGAKQVKEILKPALESPETGETLPEQPPPCDIPAVQEPRPSEFPSQSSSGADVGGNLSQPGTTQPIEKRPRSIKFGPSISFVSDEARDEISWTEGIEKVIINKYHPAFKTAEKTGQIAYHCILAVGMALLKELPSDLDKISILNKFLTNWGKI
ncbi:MAG: ATP-binding protein [bacterium]